MKKNMNATVQSTTDWFNCHVLFGFVSHNSFKKNQIDTVENHTQSSNQSFTEASCWAQIDASQCFWLALWWHQLALWWHQLAPWWHPLAPWWHPLALYRHWVPGGHPEPVGTVPPLAQCSTRLMALRCCAGASTHFGQSWSYIILKRVPRRIVWGMKHNKGMSITKLLLARSLTVFAMGSQVSIKKFLHVCCITRQNKHVEFNPIINSHSITHL